MVLGTHSEAGNTNVIAPGQYCKATCCQISHSAALPVTKVHKSAGVAPIKINGLSPLRCFAAKINSECSGCTANAGTVSVGKLTKHPERAPFIRASIETCAIRFWIEFILIFCFKINLLLLTFYFLL
jgi:hypothetical protein